MAERRRRTTSTYNRQKNRRNSYIEGNTVRQMQAVPVEIVTEGQKKKHSVSSHARKNREKALHMSLGYVIFLAVAASLLLVGCINYIQLRTESTSRMKNIASLESQVVELRAENDAIQNKLEASVDLDYIKEVAIGELGMINPTQNQVRTYSGVSDNDYVKQYQEIPKVNKAGE